MNPLNRTTRLVAAVAAASVSMALFNTVVSIAEPQRSVLIGKLAAHQSLAAGKTSWHLAAAH